MNKSDEVDDFTRERAQTVRRLPMAYQSGGAVAPGSTPVVAASEAEIRRFGQGGHICGECRFFEPGHAPAEMLRTRWMEQMVKEYGWKLEHAFPGITQETSHEIGLCAAAGDTGTTTFTAACDQFRHSAGKLKKEASPEEQQLLVRDMRVAKQAQNERVARWKRDMGIDGPGRMVEE